MAASGSSRTLSHVLLLLAAVVVVLPTFADGYMISQFASNETLIGQNVTASFGSVPNLWFHFKRMDGSILDNANETYSWVSIAEVDNSTGTAVENGNPVIVQSLDLTDTSLVWSESVANLLDVAGNPYKNINFTTTFPNGATFIVAYYHFPNNFTAEYPYINSSAILPPGTFKISVWITGWQPKNMSNLFLLRLDSAAYPYFARVTNSLSGNRWQVQVDIGSNLVVQYLNLLDVALVDDVPQHVSWYAEYVGLTLAPEPRAQGFKLYFFYPNFNNSFFYDPDMTVLVLDQGTGSSDDSMDDNTSTIVIAVLVPTITVGAFIVVVLAAIVALFLIKRKLWHVRKQLDAMNKAHANMDEEAIPD